MKALLVLAAIFICLPGMASTYNIPTRGEVTAYHLHVRTGPGTNHPSLTTIEMNTEVQITQISGNWYRVNVQGMTDVYVHSGYIRITQTETVDASEFEEEGNKNFMRSLSAYDPTAILPQHLQ